MNEQMAALQAEKGFMKCSRRNVLIKTSMAMGAFDKQRRGNTVPGRVSSVSKEVEARWVTGFRGKLGVAAAEQGAWELALGLQTVGDLGAWPAGCDCLGPSRQHRGS